MYTFDSSAWLEYLLAGIRGEKVKEVINSKEQVLTPTIVLAEIKIRLTKDKINVEQINKILKFIIYRSRIVTINKEISLLAADFKINYSLYLIDALVYACAIFTNSELLTGDQHFKNLEKVKLL